MILIDLSRDIEHKMAVLPNHPQVIITPFATHDEVRMADGYALLVGDHGAGDGRPRRHPCRCAEAFQRRSGRRFDRPGAAGEFLHRGGVPRSVAQAAEVRHLDRGPGEAAEKAAGVTIKPKDTVLLHMDFFRRTHGTPGFITDFPGLTKELATWLGQKGIGMFGVEAVSPGRPGRNNFEVHHVCRDLGFTHMEGLVNLDKLVGKGRFRFIGFPIKIKGGTGAPIRAVAWLDG